MPKPGFILLYVRDPAASAAFYGDLLGRPPVERSPTFALFELVPELMLGLWRRDGVEPAAPAAIGGTEIAFTTADVDAAHADWSGRGLTVIQPPTDHDFGRSFVVLDPDGHRLRVFTPAGV